MISYFKFDINEYPDVKEKILKKTVRYYLGRYLYKKPMDPDYMTLSKIEDLLQGLILPLVYLVDDLVQKGKMNEAKGIYLRHRLQG